MIDRVFSWIVVIEPDWDPRVLVVITAYRSQRT
jgi:hypothetical protein